jgi:kynurenine formamidase
MTSEEFSECCQRLCNWERWGADDEVGTLNYVTPEHVARACTLARTGKVFALGVPLGAEGPQRGHVRRFNPLHFMTVLPHESPRPGGVGVADDLLVLPLQAGTQWDGLSHVSHNGLIYGGRGIDAVTTRGAAFGGIERISDRVVTRGVLADVPAARGVESLEPGEPIEGEELERITSAASVPPSEGDILLVRTGFMERCRQREWEGYGGPAPGLTVSALEWIHDRRLAGVAADTTAIEVKPTDVPGQTLPFHVLALVYMGLLLGEIFDMEALARDCAADGRYEFLLVAPPLPVTAGVGTPVNPYAIK